MDFRNHTLRVAINAKHEHRGEHGGNRRANKQAEEDHRVHDVEVLDAGNAEFGCRGVDFAHERAKQRDNGKTRGRDCKALGDGLDRVACGVEFVGDGEDFVAEFAHFSKAARVVHDGAIRVVADDHADDGEHADGCHRDAEERILHAAERFAEFVRGDCRNADADHSREDGEQAVRDTRKNRERRAGFAGMRNEMDGFLGVIREVVRGEADDHANREADDASAPDSPGVVKRIGGSSGQHGIDCGGDVGAGVERLGRVAVFADAGGHNADDRRKQAQCRKHEYHVNIVAAERAAHNESRRHRSNVGIEQVRAHAGDVANVVANVVRDDGGVAGIVFGDAEFDLADKVRADIGRLGEDTAACLCKQGQRARAKAEAENGGRVMREQVDQRYAQKARADNRHAHDGAATETRHERRSDALLGGFCAASVGDGCNFEANLARDSGEEGAEDVGDDHPHVVDDFALPNGLGKEHKDQHSGNACKFCQNAIFLTQEGTRAGTDKTGCLEDLLVFAGLTLDPEVEPNGERKRQKRDEYGPVQNDVLHSTISLLLIRFAAVI